MNIFDFWLRWVRLSAQMTAFWYEQTPVQFQREWQIGFMSHYLRAHAQEPHDFFLPQHATLQ